MKVLVLESSWKASKPFPHAALLLTEGIAGGRRPEAESYDAVAVGRVVLKDVPGGMCEAARLPTTIFPSKVIEIFRSLAPKPFPAMLIVTPGVPEVALRVTCDARMKTSSLTLAADVEGPEAETMYGPAGSWGILKVWLQDPSAFADIPAPTVFSPKVILISRSSATKPAPFMVAVSPGPLRLSLQ